MGCVWYYNIDNIYFLVIIGVGEKSKINFIENFKVLKSDLVN